MTQFINTILSIFIGFFAIVVASFLQLGLQSDMAAHRLVLNELSAIVDKVEDTGELTTQDKSDFYLALATTGMVFEVDMIREMKVVNPRDSVSGEVVTSYVRVNENEKFNKGDIFTVSVKAVDYTGIQKLTALILRIWNEPINEYRSGVVDNG